LIIAADLRINNVSIINTFTFSSDKKKAEEIINHIKVKINFLNKKKRKEKKRKEKKTNKHKQTHKQQTKTNNKQNNQTKHKQNKTQNKTKHKHKTQTQTQTTKHKQQKGSSCVYGPVTEAVVQFLVDTSGSMSSQFTLDGKSYTRLGYVQTDLVNVIQNQLNSDQKFNMYVSVCLFLIVFVYFIYSFFFFFVQTDLVNVIQNQLNSDQKFNMYVCLFVFLFVCVCFLFICFF